MKFQKGHSDLVSKEARVRAGKKVTGEKHWNFKGGKPKCVDCGERVSAYKGKRCRKCFMKWQRLHPSLKGTHRLTNTGMTHFKKGMIPWNKEKKMPYTKARAEYDKRQRGQPKPKPVGFSEIMRKANPPLKKKILSSGYIYVYKPDYLGSKKESPGYGFIQEHRYIVGKFLKRILSSKEKIHHLNGEKTDNRIENLYLCKDDKEHSIIHWKMAKLVFSLIKKGRVYYDGKEFKIR